MLKHQAAVGRVAAEQLSRQVCTQSPHQHLGLGQNRSVYMDTGSETAVSSGQNLCLIVHLNLSLGKLSILSLFFAFIFTSAGMCFVWI